MTIPPYLLSNYSRIATAPDQKIALWKASFDQYRSFEVVNIIYERFPNRDIQRAGVVQLFREDLYTGFISSMIWGGINATRPQTAGGSDTAFRRLLETPRSTVEEAIQFALKEVADGNMYNVFSEFSRGGHHSLPGVGYAYFTKLFFFLGELCGTSIRPLIFDKWTSNAHCALLIQLLNDGQTLPYRGINRYYPYCLDLPSGSHDRASLYKKYVEDFNGWSLELSKIDQLVKITPAKLEEFVFGESLRINPAEDNARLELWEVISKFYDSNPISRKDRSSGTRESSTKKSKKANPRLNNRSKYHRLYAHFEHKGDEGVAEIKLTTEEIEAILNVDGPNSLPNWAFTRPNGFWSNSGQKEHVQKKSWLSNGYRVKHHQIFAEQRSGIVHFEMFE